ncbi:hypothetical protein B0H11DRAFT_2271586 [Mycena galericulata]|nr:hypothetical protein B0H11DRAFT_2271586 [Mycena galericulata]
MLAVALVFVPAGLSDPHVAFVGTRAHPHIFVGAYTHPHVVCVFVGWPPNGRPTFILLRSSSQLPSHSWLRIRRRRPGAHAQCDQEKIYPVELGWHGMGAGPAAACVGWARGGQLRDTGPGWDE